MPGTLTTVWNLLLANSLIVLLASTAIAILLALDDQMVRLPFRIGGSRIGLGLALFTFGVFIHNYAIVGGLLKVINQLTRDLFSILIGAGIATAIIQATRS